MTKHSRKELIGTDDAFVRAVTVGAEWGKVHRQKLVGVAVAVGVATIAVWAGFEYIQRRNANASTLFEQATQLAKAQVVTPDANGTVAADPSADPPTFASERDKWQAALAKYTAARDVAGEGVAVMASLAIGDLQFRLGDLEAAMQTFEGALKTLDPNDSLAFLAVERVAYMQEGKGDLEAAIATWGRLAGDKERFYDDVASFQQARLVLKKGDGARARHLLERVQQDYPQSAVAEQVGNLLKVVGSSDLKAAL